MGGDLNLKKSWHPVLMSNQRKVWEQETKALEERKRIDQLMKERAEERQIQELQEMQEAAGGKKRLNRVDWMYSGPSSGQAGTTEEMEGYLLGKRRIDGLLKPTENKNLEKSATEESFMALQHANTVRDTAAKVRDDPMLAIKKQEQAAYEAMMNDPVRRRALLKMVGGSEAMKEKEGRHHRKRRHDRDGDGRHHQDHHHHHRPRDDDSHHRSHKRRRTDGYERDERRSRDRRMARSTSSSYSRSPSPYRRRSRSPYQRDRDRRESPGSRRLMSRDRSPRKQRRVRSWNESRQRSPPSTISKGPPVFEAVDNRAERLSAMLQAANDLDQDREKRIAAIAERESAEMQAEEAARARTDKYGGKGDFINAMNRRAGEIGIGERMRRGRGGLERAPDE